MTTEAIQKALEKRFSAPCPDFYKRRIIFWQDEDKEFENIVNEINIPNVTLIKLNGRNNFAAKKRLLHDDLSSNFLIYNPFSYSDQQDNWLRDIELYSEEYRADYISMVMDELHIAHEPNMRETTKRYVRFFENKERVAKLKKIGREYRKPLELHLDILAVLTGLSEGRAQDIIITVLSAGTDDENNLLLQNIQKFGDSDAFWLMVRRLTGYVHDSDKSLKNLAMHILMSAMSQTVNMSILKGLEQHISETNQAYCYSLVHDWRRQDSENVLYDLCRMTEQELNLKQRFDGLEIDTLLKTDIFPAVDECILKRLFEEISNGIVRTELILKTTENRRTSGWYALFNEYYNALYYIGKMQGFFQENNMNFQAGEPADMWNSYAEKFYEMDTFYRKFHLALANSQKDSHEFLEDQLKQAAKYVEGLYQNRYLDKLNTWWSDEIKDNLSAQGYVSEIDRQETFYARHIKSMAEKNSRVYVIISDALRYEVAAELCGKLTLNLHGEAKIQALQAVFPSITKMGMAALLPGTKLSLDQNWDVMVNGMLSRSTVEREKILCAAHEASRAVSYQDVMEMKRAERREMIAGKDVIYIYHNTIDAIGDDRQTENKVFEACEDAIQELLSLVRVIVNDMQGTDIFITADHGFLYTYSPLQESDKVSRSAFHGDIYELGRRYALTSENTDAEYLLPVDMKSRKEGGSLKGFTPRDTTRIKIQGGGQNYVHGGISLQELTVPLITYKNIRTSSKRYVEVTNAEVVLLDAYRKISNLLFSLNFFQKQPVGDKVKACKYQVYMTDDKGEPVSDKHTIIADRESLNDSERSFKVRFSLKAASYNREKLYKLVIANDTDMPKEYPFQIDIPLAQDFGFDF